MESELFIFQYQLEPPENIKDIIKQTIHIIRDQGFEKEEQLKQEHANDPNYQFLFFPTQYFWYFQEMKKDLLQELMQQTQKKILQQGGIPPQNGPHPHGFPMHSPPPGHLPPNMMPMQMPPPHQGMIPVHHNMPPYPPPPHLQMQFMGQNGQFQQPPPQQQQNQQNKQMHPMQMMPPNQNINQPVPPMIPPQGMFNPQFMNQYPPINNQQQGQNLPPPLLHPPPLNMNNPQFNIRPPPNQLGQIPGFHAQANNLVFNPSHQQLQQQHEIHMLKMQKDEPLNKKRTRWGDQVQIINNLTSQQLNQQHFIMPGSAQSGGNQNQRKQKIKQQLLNERITYKMLSGALMVELVKQNNRKIAEENGKFLKYQPINPQNVPDYIYVDNKDQTSLKNKLRSLLEYADDHREQELKSLEKKKKEKEREQELKRMEEQGIDTYELRNPEKKKETKRNIEREIEELYYNPSSKNDMMNAEMGIRSDGRVAGPQVFGLGGQQENVFSAFRMARSKNYHSTAEERSSFRDKGSDLCYKCSRPGHIARECKYGMS